MCQYEWMQGTDPLGPLVSVVAFEGFQQVSTKSQHIYYYMCPHVHYCCYCFGEDGNLMLISDVQIVGDVCGYYLNCAHLQALEVYKK